MVEFVGDMPAGAHDRVPGVAGYIHSHRPGFPPPCGAWRAARRDKSLQWSDLSEQGQESYVRMAGVRVGVLRLQNERDLTPSQPPPSGLTRGSLAPHGTSGPTPSQPPPSRGRCRSVVMARSRPTSGEKPPPLMGEVGGGGPQAQIYPSYPPPQIRAHTSPHLPACCAVATNGRWGEPDDGRVASRPTA
jgi:hypothetical protein